MLMDDDDLSDHEAKDAPADQDTVSSTKQPVSTTTTAKSAGVDPLSAAASTSTPAKRSKAKTQDDFEDDF